MSPLRLHPHAKINLGLRILGRRSDGYHDLATRFQTIDLIDDLEIEATGEGLDLVLEGTPLGGGTENLVLQAARLLRESVGGAGARFRLVKRIPPGAGLGGGSSDAAATLVGLDRLWGLGLGRAGLLPLAARLGADVPFFLVGGTAEGRERGDAIRPLPELEECWIALVIPPFSCSTAEAYQAWDRRNPADAIPSDKGEGEEGFRNDFQPLQELRHPILARYRSQLLQGGAFVAALSGSGSAVYGLFRDRRRMKTLPGLADWEGARVLECRPVARRRYQVDSGLALSD